MAGQHTLRILVAEDEALIRMDLVETLAELGFEVVAAVQDGRSAVEAVRRFAPDVALLDIRMPVMDGLSATEAIADTTAVVLLTAFSQPELVSQAAQAGAMGYLVKPFKTEDLAPAVHLARVRHLEMAEARRERDDMGQRLLERKTIERAKGLVQEHLGVGEAEAYTWLRTQAMTGRTTILDISQRVLTGRWEN